ncbi:MAG: hypothetical protein CMP85_02145 [Gammaproteobacteria bacterium]|nr:hypothetical protein [Gammaproteobacteria bacterium]
MDFATHVRHLSERAKPVTYDKLNNLQSGMMFNYRWHPVEQRFAHVHGGQHSLFKDGVVVVYFVQDMVSVRFPPRAFDGELLPKTWLNDAIQIKYRCKQTHNVLLGCRLITSELSPDMIMIDGRSLTEHLKTAKF